MVYNNEMARQHWITKLIRTATWRAWEEVVGPDLVYDMQTVLEQDGTTDPDAVWECVDTEAQYLCSDLVAVQMDIVNGALAMFHDHDEQLDAREMVGCDRWVWIEPTSADIWDVVEVEFSKDTLRDIIRGMAIAIAYIWNKQNANRR